MKDCTEGVKGYRYRIGADIILDMDAHNELPLPNIHRLGKVMLEFFGERGYLADMIKEHHKYRWRPTKDYFVKHMPDFRRVLRMEAKYFEFVRDEGSIKGCWKFADKAMFEDNLRRERADVATRTETFNNRLED